MSPSRPFLALIGATLALAACGADGTNPSAASARLRLVHASVNAPAVDLLVDGRTVARGVAYTQASNFVEVAAGRRALEERAGDARLGAGAVTLEAGRSYTVLFSAGLNDSAMVIAVDTAGGNLPDSAGGGNGDTPADTGAVPSAGKVKLRVVHNAPQAPLLDVYLTGAADDLAGATPLVEPFTFGAGQSAEFPGYVERDPGSWRIRFTEDGTKHVVLDTGPISMAAGQVRTFILVSSDTTGLGVIPVRER